MGPPVLTSDFNVAADGKCAQRVERLSLTDSPDARRESNGKFVHTHPSALRNNKVPQLMDYNQQH